ncbi:MAG: hypothetical protein IH948_05530 [Bacteroidetes bacterium]|nr:hypothetical protein [Bacteroidota bacterium]
MNKNQIINLVIMMVTTIIMVFVIEYALRFALFNESKAFNFIRKAELYSAHIRHDDEDFYNTNYWKLNYLFNKKFNVKNPHPLLGWIGKFNKKNYNHQDIMNVKNKRPVLLFGDSFAMCVDSTECFEEILNIDTAFTKENYLLNYGVGGYGVDQIYLLFDAVVDRFDKPFVIFSLLTTDLDRSMLSVRDGQKPYFIMSENKLELKGTPITLTSEEYFEQNPPQISSYLWNIFKGSKLNFVSQNKREESLCIDKIKTLNEAILVKAFSRLKELKTDYVVLIFHPVQHKQDNWRVSFLRELCNKKNVPYICDVDIRESDIALTDYSSSDYAIKGDGYPSTYSNKIVASELKRYILDNAYRSATTEQNLAKKNKFITKGVDYYRNKILSSPSWLQSI